MKKLNVDKYLRSVICLAIVGMSSTTLAADSQLYGYFSWRAEKVWDELAINGVGETVTADAPREIAIPSFNIMLQSRINSKAKTFINLDGSGGEDVTVKNIWGEYKVSDALNIRVGKTYRRFGLYNEILDAVPTYIGIEPPELFDKDHLILSRETLAMVHGRTVIGDGDLRYSVSMDNGEGGPNDDQIPLGFDLRYEWDLGNYMVGVSGYNSGGETTSDVGMGDGSPRTGVLPWMSGDDFSIFGAYGQFQISALQLQFAWWSAEHNATRDAGSIVQLINNTTINAAQMSRFLVDVNAPVNVANVNTNGNYDVTTWYVRAGYSIYHDLGEFIPYAQWDFYENPETIESKSWGGDNEAGQADNGKFTKATVGIIYRPVPQLAIKLDGSMHILDYNGSSESYPEIRFDISYIFGQ